MHSTSTRQKRRSPSDMKGSYRFEGSRSRSRHSRTSKAPYREISSRSRRRHSPPRLARENYNDKSSSSNSYSLNGRRHYRPSRDNDAYSKFSRSRSKDSFKFTNDVNSVSKSSDNSSISCDDSQSYESRIEGSKNSDEIKSCEDVKTDSKEQQTPLEEVKASWTRSAPADLYYQRDVKLVSLNNAV